MAEPAYDTYEIGVEVGCATAAVVGTNNYAGNIVMDFQILPKDASVSEPAELTLEWGK